MSIPAGFQIHKGDLVVSLGNIPNGIRPVHAYLPMRITPNGAQIPIENPPVAYRNQLRAKRICDRERKRWARYEKAKIRTHIMGITIK